MVSVIVTTFNRKEYLSKTIKSVLNQTYSDIELIVVDNFSNYDFFNLVNSFNDSRIKGFQNSNKGIISVNRNYGIRKAKGEFIAFCDDDDFWSKNKLENQLDIFSKKNIGMVSCSMKKFSQNKFFDQSLKSKLLGVLLGTNIVNAKYTLIFFNFISTSSVIVRKSLIEKYLFDESQSIVSCEDFDLWLKLCSQMDHFYINEKLIYYRVHEHQATISLFKIEKKNQVLKNQSKGFNKIQLLIYFITNKLF